MDGKISFSSRLTNYLLQAVIDYRDRHGQNKAKDYWDTDSL